jgi:signal transduction histidine kinase
MAATVRPRPRAVICRATDPGSSARPIAQVPERPYARRMRRLRQHPRALDVVLAGLITSLLVWEVVNTDVEGPLIGLVAASLAIGLPLAWRRDAPLAVAAVVGGACVVQRALASEQEPQTPLLALLLAAFSAGAHAEGRMALAGLACCIASVGAIEAGDLVVMGPVLVGTWSAGRVVRARERDARRLRELTEALERERVEEARIAAADERARIARELHDVIAHAMSTIVLEAGAERVHLPPGQDGTRRTLQSIERTGRQALTEMRRLVGVLRSDDEEAAWAPPPSLANLDELIAHVSRAGLTVEMRVEGDPVELAPGLDVNAYRIVQEALTNVLKHAGDARATVVLTYNGRSLGIEVADDGRGGTPNGGGHGLEGLRERVAMFGGEIVADGQPGGGFVVRARLPIA